MPANPRFFCPQTAGEFATLDVEESRHARRSLRLSAGDVVELFDGCGWVARGPIVEELAAARSSRARSRAEVRVAIHQRSETPPPTRRLTLIVAGCKGPRLSWLVEKCTELGAFSLVFAEFERSVVRVGVGQIEKLRRTAIEACKQCGSAWLPIIERGAGPLDVWKQLRSERSEARGRPELLIAQPDAAATPAGNWFAHPRRSAEVAAVIGPEGGLTDGELQSLRQAGGEPVRLAEHTLRVETAAVALAAVWAAATVGVGHGSTDGSEQGAPGIPGKRSD